MFRLLSLSLPLSLACTSATPTNDTGLVDTQDTSAVTGCRSTPQDPDRDRLVLVQTPYNNDAQSSNTWRQLRLSTDGALQLLTESLELGRAPQGQVVFTPDASLGFVAQDDGSIGIVSNQPDGPIEVANPAYRGDFYADSLTMDPSGEILWVLDTNWQENGGGIYRVDIDCSSPSLSGAERILQSKNASKLLLLEATAERREALVIARGFGSPDTQNDHELLHVDLFQPDTPIRQAPIFADPDAMHSDAVLFDAQRYLLVGDNAEFSQTPNRIAVVALQEEAIETVQILENILDPVGLIPSPWEDQLLVVSGYGDAIFTLRPTGDAQAPFSLGPEPSYTDGAPQLPTASASVQSGALQGHVLVTENTGIRQLQLGLNAALTDQGLVAIGESFEGIAGAIGIAP